MKHSICDFVYIFLEMFKTIIEFVLMKPNIILKGVGTVGMLSTSLSTWQLALILTFVI